MISAFAKGAQVLDEERYRAVAVRAAGFIEQRMYNRADGTLLRRYRDGDAAIPGFLDDYAFFVQAMLDLYETDFDPRRIEMAIALTRKMQDLFEDRENGAFFTTTEGDASLVLRMKDDYDGAEPAANSVALLNLLRLAEITNREEFQKAAERTLSALAPRIANQPVAVPQMLVGLDYSLSRRRQVVLAGDPDNDLTREFLRHLRGSFQPHTAAFLVDGERDRTKLEQLNPAIGDLKELDGRPTAYVCEGFTCQLPTHDVAKFAELLK